MAALEDVIGATGGGLLAGVAVAVLAPAILPAELGLRSVAKMLVKGVLVVMDGVIAVGLKVADQVGDLVVEARDEIAAGTRGIGS